PASGPVTADSPVYPDRRAIAIHANLRVGASGTNAGGACIDASVQPWPCQGTKREEHEEAGAHAASADRIAVYEKARPDPRGRREHDSNDDALGGQYPPRQE